jgi:hypothetical protein
MKLLYIGSCLILLLVITGCSSSKEDRTLVYRNDFDSASSLDDWVMEGPGVAEIDSGRLLIHSKWQSNLEEIQGQIDLRESGGGQYYSFLQQWVEESEPEMLDKYMLTKDGNSRFIGGHVQYWNKVPHPENFLIRIRFQPACLFPLHMVSFCGRGLNGEDVLDPSLAPRFGLGGQYMNGDIQNYRISYWTGTRGTINMRRAPGRVLVDGVEGHLPMSALEKEVLLEIYRFEGKVVFKCDGETKLEWTDPDPLSAGSFSLRLMAAAKGWYDQYEVYELHSDPFDPEGMKR